MKAREICRGYSWSFTTLVISVQDTFVVTRFWEFVHGDRAIQTIRETFAETFL